MTLNQILQETSIEIGNDKILDVRKGVKYSGASINRTSNFKEIGPETSRTVSKIIGYLKAKNLWEKVASVQDFDTCDIVLKADGGCQINFDDGGGINIPARVVNKPSEPQKKGILDGLKRAIKASVKTKK